MLTNSQKSVAPTPPVSISRVVSTAAMKGTHIHNFAGEDLGKVDDFVINFETGRIAYVVVSQGGFLGIGDKLFAVPWELFSVRPESRELFLDIDKQLLLDAPGFDRNDSPDMVDEAWTNQIRAHYAQKPYWNSDVTYAGDYTGDDRLDKPDRDRI